MEDQTTRVTNVQNVLDGAPTGSECLVVIYGANIGRKYELFEDVCTIGRDPDSTVVLESDAVSRRHARIEKLMDARFIIDMNSTNGTYLSDTPVKPRAKLESGAFIKIGDTIFKYLAGDHIETAYFEEIYRMMVIDGLTQIANKRALDDFLEKEMARARRYERPLSVLMMDLDHFKAVNDQHGHLTGDVVLKEMAEVIRERIRREELFARYGGEEFVIVLPETDRKGGIEFAENVRRMVEGLEVYFEGQTIRITISIGVADFDLANHKGPEDLLKAADKNLYIAKHDGRNCVRG
ncbi:MAG: diguanylate cyclase [Deltaproteobacteria bacterium]|nr:diguanylate cyclase [Deltaproteobacteria bacterium]